MSGPVILTVPADTSHIALARTVTAAMAARADLPLDQLEDARLAVDEAVAQAIAGAPADSAVTIAFAAIDGVLDVLVSAPSSSGEVPSPGTFGWTILTALVDTAEASVEAGLLELRLHIVRSVPVGS